MIDVTGRVVGERTLAYKRREHLLWQAAVQLTSEGRETLKERTSS